MPLASSKGRTKPEPQYLAITELVTSLVESYQREQRITHVSTAPLPSRDSVIAILKLLREILFPGYFGRQGLKLETLAYHVGEDVTTLHERLSEQVENAFRHQAVRGGQDIDGISERAATATNGFSDEPAPRARVAGHRCASHL